MNDILKRCGTLVLSLSLTLVVLQSATPIQSRVPSPPSTPPLFILVDRTDAAASHSAPAVIHEGFYREHRRHAALSTLEAIAGSEPKPNPSSKMTSSPSLSKHVAGVASWYCKAGVSVCHYAYPPGSMVAAACGKLRRAMGPNWRGKTVTVAGNGHRVTVKLVDWCGSTTKLIDLYWAPMHALGGTGVLPVTVGW